MQKFKVAHIREQGQDIIMVLVNRNFSIKSEDEQNEICIWLQGCATLAGLAGTVVPVWDNGGRLSFRAPQRWHPFFKSISLSFVAANINKTLSCSE